MNNFLKINSCPITGKNNKVSYFNLGDFPIVNNLLNTREESLNTNRYPLNVDYYPDSGISCLDTAINGDLLFNTYLYKSEVNKPYYDHCKKMFSYIANYIDIKDETNFLDIGGNDGTLLLAFKNSTDKKINTLNIDPSKNLAELCKLKNIEVITAFFNEELAKSIDKKYSIITCTNVFQHLKDLNSFVIGIQHLLEENGIWVLEFPYWINSIETNQFDQVYHEHIYYHSVKPLKILMNNHGLEIVNISKHDIHGGSLRLIIVKKDSYHKKDSTVQNFLDYEALYNEKKYIDWGSKINNHIVESKNFIRDLIDQGKTIFGFGAAAKGCVYLNAMQITYKEIDYIIDDTDIKQGKFVPGTGIEVVSRDILKEKSPDYILILAHNFSQYIIESLNKDYKGKYIILIPTIQIL